MTVFINDPFEMIVDVFKDLLPGKTCRLIWDMGLEAENGEEVCGMTVFPEDGGMPSVHVNANVPVYHAAEILAHELAHVAVGADESHGEAWEKAFDSIHAEYCRRVEHISQRKD